MAGFIPRSMQGGDDSGETRDFVITNSTTITIGDAVRLASGFIALADQTNRPLGVVTGIVKRESTNANDPTLPLGTDAIGSVSGTRTGNPGNVGSETYASASDNQTVDMVMARVLVDPSQEYYNDSDGTLTAAMIGTYFDCLAASDQIDQSSTSTTGQFVLMAIDPDNDADASKGIFRIAEHALSLG